MTSNGYTTPTVAYNGTVKVNSVRLRAQKSEQRQKAHRIVNSDCPVHHLSEAPTVRTQRPGDLAGAPDSVRWHTRLSGTPCDRSPHQRHFGGWGYKYPQPPTIHCIQVFSLQTSYKSYSIQYKTQTRDQIHSQVQRSFQSNSD